MCLVCTVAYAAVGTVVLATNTGMPQVATLSNTKIDNEMISSQVMSLQEVPQSLAATKLPSLKEPGWLTQQNAAEAAARANAAKKAVTKTVTYDVTTRGAITANLAEFRSQANATLNDPRGWARMGVAFQEVASGGSFTLVLS